MNFEKELTEIVEKYVDVTKKQSKAASVDDLVKDEATIARLNRIYDTKDVLEDLYDGQPIMMGIFHCWFLSYL